MDHQSFAQLLGNYGEFIGAIAVVVTLFYLALQVRHTKEATEANTRSIEEGHKYAKAQAYQARTDSAAGLFQLRNSDVMAKVVSGVPQSTDWFIDIEKISSLSPSELESLRSFQWVYMLLTDNVNYQRELGLIEDSSFERDSTALASSLTIWAELGIPIMPGIRKRAAELGLEAPK